MIGDGTNNKPKPSVLERLDEFERRKREQQNTGHLDDMRERRKTDYLDSRDER